MVYREEEDVIIRPVHMVTYTYKKTCYKKFFFRKDAMENFIKQNSQFTFTSQDVVLGALYEDNVYPFMEKYPIKFGI